MVKTTTPITWEAEETVPQNRNGLWFVGLFVIGTILCIFAILYGWWTFFILIILSIITILISALRPPRKIKYTLNQDGLLEENKLHKYDEFRAFGILKENSHFSAVLIPKKRFGMNIKVYFPSNSGEGIVDALGAKLPMEEVKLDFLDKIVNFLRI